MVHTEELMPFGKWKDEPLSAVPGQALVHYLDWEQMPENARKVIEEEVMLRGLWFGKHKGIDLREVDKDYLDWMMRKMDFGEGFKNLMWKILDGSL
jgi:uncharacterized protein (DUF3820 family)